MSNTSTFSSGSDVPTAQSHYDPNPPTVAAFAPSSSSGYSASAKQRSTVIVHKKSPLLVATPPQITRALAHSHPFILPLNKLVGLISWSTDDAWESFLLVAAFWAACLYGDVVVRYATPLNGVVFLIALMYTRRWSPLSASTRTGEKHDNVQRAKTTISQHKSLDEIVETLQQFTSRCRILLDPFLQTVDFLSTQQTATSATTRPALITLFIRILLVSPIWVFFALPPVYVLTPRRTILSVGTVILTWHSRPARVIRVILWRSVFVRQVSCFITGLHLDAATANKATAGQRGDPSQTPAAEVALASKRQVAPSGVRFTFILYENQRRWLGLGWTTSLFAHERAPWTDEQLNAAPSKEDFLLPEVDGGLARWRWVDGTQWQIDHGASDKSRSKPDKSATSSSKQPTNNKKEEPEGWIYYDNKWNDGKLQDGWGRYTRRRKWFRDAELVESTSSNAVSSTDVSTEQDKVRQAKAYGQSLKTGSAKADMERDLGDSVATIVPDALSPNTSKTTAHEGDASSLASPKRRTGWFKRSHTNTNSKDLTTGLSHSTAAESDKLEQSSTKGSVQSNFSTRSKDNPADDVYDQWRDSGTRGRNLGVGEDVMMGFG